MDRVFQLVRALGAGAVLMGMPLLVIVVATAMVALACVFTPAGRKDFLLDVLKQLVDAIRALRGTETGDAGRRLEAGTDQEQPLPGPESAHEELELRRRPRGLLRRLRVTWAHRRHARPARRARRRGDAE